MGDGNEATLVMISSDGIEWSSQTIASNKYMRDIIYENGKFFAVGDVYDTETSSYESAVISSSDGETWTVVKNDFDGVFKDILYTDKYIIVGYKQEGYQKTSKIFTSSDGTSWEEVADLTLPSSGVGLKYMTYFNGKYYSAGSFGYNFYTSDDLKTWTSNSSLSSYQGTINSLKIV